MTKLAEEMHSTIEQVSEILGRKFKHGEIRVVDRGCPHVPPKSLEGGAAVYCFIYKGEFLKIGKANKKSTARFCHQHYGAKRSVSTLAKTLCRDKSMYQYGIQADGTGIKEWMTQNLQRVDIYINCEQSVWATSLVEGIMHYKYQPRYEGNPGKEDAE